MNSDLKNPRKPRCASRYPVVSEKRAIEKNPCYFFTDDGRKVLVDADLIIFLLPNISHGTLSEMKARLKAAYVSTVTLCFCETFDTDLASELSVACAMENPRKKLNVVSDVPISVCLEAQAEIRR